MRPTLNPFIVSVTRLALTTLALSFSAAAPLHAAVNTWDTVAGDSIVTGGAGDWNTVNANWTTDAGLTNISWPAAGTDNDAVFGGVAGVVTIDAGGIAANDIAFNTTDYSLGGGDLTLNGAANLVSQGAGITATVNSNIVATAGGARFTGGGLVKLAGNYTGGGTGKQLTINGGSTLEFSGTTLATHKLVVGSAAASGTLNFTSGTGSVTDYFSVGDGGVGTVNVTGGGITLNSGFALFLGSNSTGSMSVSPGSMAIRQGNLWIGAGYNGIRPEPATGTLTVSGTGTFSYSAANTIRLTYAAGQTGTLNLNGGTFNLNGTSITKGIGTAAVNIDGGLLRLTANNGNVFGTGLNPVINAGGFTVDTNGFNGTIPTDLTGGAGAGGLTKKGAGLLSLLGTGTYTGPTTITEGGLVLGKTTSVPNVAAVTVAAGNSLGARVGGAGLTDPEFATLLSTANFVAGSSVVIDTSNGNYTQTANLGTATSAGLSVGLVKSGANNLTLDLASQTFTGNIRGTAGTLVLDSPSNVTYAGTITGTMDLRKLGVGNLNLTGATSSVAQFSASAGTVNLSGTLNSTAKFVVNDGGMLNFTGTTQNTGSYTGFGDTTDGTMNLSSGSFTSNPSAGTFIGNNTTGLLNITGGSFTVGTNTNIGIGSGYNNNGGGTGTLTISGSGSFSTGVTTGNFILGSQNATPGVGTINLDGGTFATNRFLSRGGGIDASAVFNFNGGVFRAEGANTTLAVQVIANVRNGGAIVDTNGSDIFFSADLVHSGIGGDAAIDGGLTKRGAGKLTLNGYGNAYTGKTVVEGGSLTLYDPFLADTSGVTIGSGATLDLLHADTDTIGSLRIAGTPAAIGIWGADGSGAQFTTTAITGSGFLQVTSLASTSAYSTWASANMLAGADALATADPDKDGASNLVEFALNGDPNSGANNGLARALIQDASAPAGQELTYIVAVRDGATFAVGAGGSQTATVDGVVYEIQGSLDLGTFASPVSHLSVSDTAAGLPSLAGTAWEYHTFKLDASEGLGGKGFMRVSLKPVP